MENDNTFLKGKTLQPLMRYVIPLALSLALQALYGAVDLWVVGRFSNTSSVSAVATGTQVLFLITAVILGLTTGATVLMAQAVGEGNPQKAGNIVVAEIRLLAAVACLLSVLTVVFAGPIASVMHAPDESFTQMTAYLRICGSGIVFVAAYNVISSIYRGIGDSKTPLMFITIACAFNIIWDFILVAVLQMNAAGAALATVLSQAVSVGVSAARIRKSRLPFKMTWDRFAVSREVWNIVRIGFPVVLNEVLTGISFLAVTSMINSLGLIASASIGIAEKLFTFLSLLPTAFSNGLAAFVGQNAGAGQFDRARDSLWAALGVSLVFSVSTFALAQFQGSALTGIFESDPHVIAATNFYLKSSSFEYLFISVTYCLEGYFNGLGKTVFVMVQGIASAFLVRIPLSYYFSQCPNGTMYQIGTAVSASAGVSLLLCAVYYLCLESTACGRRPKKSR